MWGAPVLTVTADCSNGQQPIWGARGYNGWFFPGEATNGIWVLKFCSQLRFSAKYEL